MTEKWAVFGSEDTTAIWVEDESGKRVCTLRNCETDLDRANLIAAAPDLLEALRELLDVYLNDQGYLPEVEQKARAAIAKSAA